MITNLRCYSIWAALPPGTALYTLLYLNYCEMADLHVYMYG